ncbi:MAG: acyltransferase, partial [Candidatus Eremiobacteraeota bacterium]|nr:acyltransferase [Candidatus Eremiobacteraeota bacterium]
MRPFERHGAIVERLPHVDGLRAVAILTVVTSHAAKYTLDYHHSSLFHMLYEGAHGVDLFFVISGLCLAYPILQRLRRTGFADFSLPHVFGRRILRIGPPFWCAFAVILIVALAVVGAGSQLPWPTVKMPTAFSAVQQLLFIDPKNELCGSFWTLAIEFRWYLAFPCLLWLWIRSPILFAAVGVGSYSVHPFTSLPVADFWVIASVHVGNHRG